MDHRNDSALKKAFKRATLEMTAARFVTERSVKEKAHRKEKPMSDMKQHLETLRNLANLASGTPTWLYPVQIDAPIRPTRRV